ncbi:lytic murein transglycosylase [Frankia sp. AgPm24]|uniref:lytic transglycosylase domain-containing protein n=1 Tax=Frankia sp. AgPm24 TaxID=631128 RepID=UPI00200BBEF3|nr:lytic transglycosylase domain-containing protein [Frankia sp. AgPm24]MCK9923453.1 lytic murein transglycosylase [Frankia sp. AgPm24]
MPPLISNATRSAPPAADNAVAVGGGTPEPLSAVGLAEQAAHESTSGTLLAPGSNGIPGRVLAAYHRSAERLAQEQPGCRLRWELLAGIGKVESGHAAGRPITADGTITRAILGPPLDGHGGRALIRDSDGGRLDQDPRYDRAVGPMQFIPTTWATRGRDGSGDGQRDPHNIDDATLAAGGYLCAGGRDLTVPASLRAAIFSYNPSDDYVRAVLAWMTGYQGSGAIAVTSPAASGSGSAPITVVALTPRPSGPDPAATAQGSAPAPSSAQAAPTSSPAPSAGRSGAPAPTTVCPSADPRVRNPIVVPRDLDPAIPGYEQLDLLGTVAPQPIGDLAVEADARTSTGALVAHTRTTVAANPTPGSATAPSAATTVGAGAAGQRPVLLARLDGRDLAAASLPGHTVTVTVTIPNDARTGCPAREILTTRIGNIDPGMFAGSRVAAPGSGSIIPLSPSPSGTPAAPSTAPTSVSPTSVSPTSTPPAPPAPPTPPAPSPTSPSSQPAPERAATSESSTAAGLTSTSEAVVEGSTRTAAPAGSPAGRSGQDAG